MKQVNKNPDIYFYLFIIVCLRILLYILEDVVRYNNYREVRQIGQETVAEIWNVSISRGGIRGNIVSYEFYVADERVLGELHFDDDTTYVYMTFDTTNIGRKFIVKYLPDNPDINVLLLDREVK